jgi:hypothetical protein
VLLVLVVVLSELLVVAPDCVLPKLELDPKDEFDPELEVVEPRPRPPLEEPKPEPEDPKPELEDPKPELEEPRPELEEPRPELEEPRPELEEPNPELEPLELELLELELGFVELRVEIVALKVEPVLVPESSAGSQPSPSGWRTGRGTSCVKSCVMRRMVVCTACRRAARASSASRFCSA